MLLPTKTTNKLFLNKFRYKIVLITKFASIFRNKNLDSVQEKLLYYKDTGKFPAYVWNGNLKDYDSNLLIVRTILEAKSPYHIMVSSPFLSFYTDDKEEFNSISKSLKNLIKYVSVPTDNTPVLEQNTVYLKRINYDYKITISNKITNNESFFNWSRDNVKIRMPIRCKDHVRRGYRTGDSYFYVKDAKTLSLVQMFIGPSIQRIDKVVKITD